MPVKGLLITQATIKMVNTMCHNIKILFNFDPPASVEEIHASSIQFVRKLSGFSSPSQANQAVFDQAVAAVSEAAQTLIAGLVTRAPAKNRATEAATAKARSAQRFAKLQS